MLLDPSSARRRPYALLWWWSAVVLAVWPIVQGVAEVLSGDRPRFGVVECWAPREEPLPSWRHTAEDAAEYAGGLLYDATAPVLILLAIALHRYAAGRPHLHLRAARWAFVLITAADALLPAEDVLVPPPLDETCLALLGRPTETLSDHLDTALTWIVSANVAVILAGAVATRALTRRTVTTALAAAVAAGVAVAAVAALPERFTVPALAGDGTPRYAVLGDALPLIVDLETGAIVESVPPTDGKFVVFGAVVRDREPGHYVIALSTRSRVPDQPWSVRGLRSRIYRMTVDDTGRARLGERLSGDLAGVVQNIAVSATGRVAYSRMVEGRDGRTSSFAGVLDPGREWAAYMPYYLYWIGPDTLVFPRDSRGADPGASWMVTRDVRTGREGRHPLPPGGSGAGNGMAVLPDGRLILTGIGEDASANGDRLILFEGATAAGTVHTSGPAKIRSVALDPSGRHLLIAQATIDADSLSTTTEIVRVDLTSLPPTPAAGTRADLRLPKRVIWRGPAEGWQLAW
ncbi:hypothetical protein GCM10023259_000980 [Thermocatellispora tengchongensis]